MGDKDLEKVLANISNSEREAAVKQAQIDRLKELSEKQKGMLAEFQSIIEEQKKKIDTMFDVPADVEQLKKIIGAQRADLNEKDQKLELAYSRVAELEQEMKGTSQTQNILSQKFDETYSQIGKLKSEIAEKDANLSLKETEIRNFNLNISDLKKINEETNKELDILNEKLRNKEIEIIEVKGKVEAELKEQIFTERDEAFKKITELESKNLEMELSTKEKLSNAEQSLISYEEIKKKYEDLIQKYDGFTKDNTKNKEEINNLQKQIKELTVFKDENGFVIEVFHKIRALMDTDNMFRIFGILWDVGEIPVSDLKNAVGVPTVTMQKYINQYEKFGIAKVNEAGKIALIGK